MFIRRNSTCDAFFFFFFFGVMPFRKLAFSILEKEKKKKKLIAAKSGLVGMKGYLETYNRKKFFECDLFHAKL